MRSKIKLNEQSGRTVAEVFDDFVFTQPNDKALLRYLRCGHCKEL